MSASNAILIEIGQSPKLINANINKLNNSNRYSKNQKYKMDFYIDNDFNVDMIINKLITIIIEEPIYNNVIIVPCEIGDVEKIYNMMCDIYNKLQ